MRQIALLLVVIGLVIFGPVSLGAATTPEATPIADDQPLLVGLDGVEAAAIRAMEIERIKESGLLVLTFEVIRFSDGAAAEGALAELVRRVVARFDADRNGAAPYQKTDVATSLGDEIIVYTGEQKFDEPLGDVTSSPVALVFVRTGAYLHIAVGVTFRGDPLPDLIDILTISTNRNEGGNATPVNAAGHRTGGLWDMLPGLADVPPDFTIAEEIVPEPFAPLPDQTAENAN